ncbi:galactose ABC transporter substrate-binding protein [Oscillospiraceae bacterium MB08-C2-2]|nr:galactose ABC transporter substrate-binding protein [Oscillospiraceae bacterium MB08-C2-2]
MKKTLSAALAATLMLAALTGCGGGAAPAASSAAPAAPAAPASSSQAAASSAPAAADITVGVAIRKFDDTFLTEERNAISAKADELGFKVDIVDSQASQTTQNDKVDMFITKKYNALGINMQERSASDLVIEKAMCANIPVVFFNTEPFPEHMAKWENVYYVGAKAEESGTIQGQALAAYWLANPDADKNGDGVLQYAMLKGEPGHQDAELRTEYSIKALEAAGIKVEKLAEDTAMWNRVDGQNKMQAFLAAHGDKIEAVLANNDDMALGAIEALKAGGYFTGDKFMPVVGVDATEPGKVAIEEGTMLATALNDAVNQGGAVAELTHLLAKGEKPTSSNFSYTVTDKQYVWIPYVAVTKENLADFR